MSPSKSPRPYTDNPFNPIPPSQTLYTKNLDVRWFQEKRGSPISFVKILMHKPSKKHPLVDHFKNDFS